MSRRRWKWDLQLGRLVELPTEWEPTPRTEIMTGAAYEGVRALDGTDLSSRRKHETYMRDNGLALASDYRETWKQAARERERMAQGDFDHKARREDVGRAVYRKFRG